MKITKFRETKVFKFCCICFVVCCVFVVFAFSSNAYYGNKIKNTFFNECPEYKLCKTEIEKTDIVREWVYRYTGIPYENVPYVTYDTRWYNLFRRLGLCNYYIWQELTLYKVRARGGYYCGGMSITLSDMYVFLGYDAAIVDFAVFDDEVVASHVVTIVFVDDKWIVQDATFNLSYEDEFGRRLAIEEIQQNLLHGKPVNIKRGNLSFRGAAGKRTDSQISAYDNEYRHYLNADTYQVSFSSLVPYFNKNYNTDNVLYLFLYPVGMVQNLMIGNRKDIELPVLFSNNSVNIIK